MGTLGKPVVEGIRNTRVVAGTQVAEDTRVVGGTRVVEDIQVVVLDNRSNPPAEGSPAAESSLAAGGTLAALPWYTKYKSIQENKRSEASSLGRNEASLPPLS